MRIRSGGYCNIRISNAKVIDRSRYRGMMNDVLNDHAEHFVCNKLVVPLRRVQVLGSMPISDATVYACCVLNESGVREVGS